MFLRISLLLAFFVAPACTTVVEGIPQPPAAPARPFTVVDGDPVNLSAHGLHSRIRDANGQEWLVALNTEKGVGIRNVATGVSYVERWQGDKLIATLTTSGKVWTSTTWRGDRGLSKLQLADWAQRLEAAVFVAASTIPATAGSDSLSLAADADCYDRNNDSCSQLAGEFVDRGCTWMAGRCAAMGGRLGPYGAGAGAALCYLGCKGLESYGVGEACKYAANTICGTSNGTECDPNNSSCDASGEQSGSGNGTGDGTDGDIGNGEDNGAGDWQDPSGQDSGSGNGAGDGTDGDVGNGEDNGAGDWQDPSGQDSGSGNGTGDGTDGDVGNGEDNGAGDWNPGQEDPGDWEPEDWNGDGSPGNGGEAGGDYDDYEDTGSGSGAGDGTDGDVGNGEDNGAGDWNDPSGEDTGSGNGAGDGTDGDVGNGEDNGAGDWGDCLCS